MRRIDCARSRMRERSLLTSPAERRIATLRTSLALPRLSCSTAPWGSGRRPALLFPTAAVSDRAAADARDAADAPPSRRRLPTAAKQARDAMHVAGSSSPPPPRRTQQHQESPGRSERRAAAPPPHGGDVRDQNANDHRAPPFAKQGRSPSAGPGQEGWHPSSSSEASASALGSDGWPMKNSWRREPFVRSASAPSRTGGGGRGGDARGQEGARDKRMGASYASKGESVARGEGKHWRGVFDPGRNSALIQSKSITNFIKNVRQIIRR